MSETHLTTASAVIDRLGGNRPVADLTDRTPAAVSNWRGFNAFPSDTYIAMSRALANLGESAPLALWLGKRPRRGGKRAEHVSAA